MPSASAADVKGPVATMTLRQSGGGRPATLLAAKVDQRVLLERGLYGGREAVAVDRQRAAGRNLVRVSGAHDQRIQPAQFLVQQADCVVAGIIGAERVRADEFGTGCR